MQLLINVTTIYFLSLLYQINEVFIYVYKYILYKHISTAGELTLMKR